LTHWTHISTSRNEKIPLILPLRKNAQEKARTTLEMVLAFFITGEVCVFALIDGGD